MLHVLLFRYPLKIISPVIIFVGVFVVYFVAGAGLRTDKGKGNQNVDAFLTPASHGMVSVLVDAMLQDTSFESLEFTITPPNNSINAFDPAGV